MSWGCTRRAAAGKQTVWRGPFKAWFPTHCLATAPAHAARQTWSGCRCWPRTLGPWKTSRWAVLPPHSACTRAVAKLAACARHNLARASLAVPPSLRRHPPLQAEVLGELEDRVCGYLQKGTDAEEEILGSVGAALPDPLKDALPEPLKEALKPRASTGALLRAQVALQHSRQVHAKCFQLRCGFQLVSACLPVLISLCFRTTALAQVATRGTATAAATAPHPSRWPHGPSAAMTIRWCWWSSRINLTTCRP